MAKTIHFVSKMAVHAHILKHAGTLIPILTLY